MFCVSCDCVWRAGVLAKKGRAALHVRNRCDEIEALPYDRARGLSTHHHHVRDTRHQCHCIV
jgi:hypothetical protein